MASLRKNKDQFYTDARVHLTNALEDGVILDNLNRLGFDDAWLRASLDVLEQCLEAESSADAALGTQKQSTQDLQSLTDEVQAEYIDYVTVAQDAFGNDDAITAMRLHERRKRDFAGWTSQASALLDTALGDARVGQLFEAENVTREVLQDLRDRLQHVIDANTQQEGNKGDYETAIERAQQLRRQLADRLVSLRRRGRRALRTHPQKLEKIGIRADADLDGDPVEM